MFIIILAANLLPFFRKRGEPKPEEPKEEEKGAQELEVYKKRAALYRKIIDRYRVLTETSEDKSVPELKELIKPQDAALLEIKNQILKEFANYDYEKNFLAAAQKAYEFVNNEIKTEPLPLEFWLSPADIMELRVADEMDKAILLCSLLISLGNKDAKVIVEIKGDFRHAFVMFEFEGKSHLFDPAHKINLSGEKESLLKQVLSKEEESRVVYEFNDVEYNEW